MDTSISARRRWTNCRPGDGSQRRDCHLSIADLAGWNGWPKSATNLHTAIQASKSRGLARLLFASGIRYVGENVARILAMEFGSLEKITGARSLAAVHGIGLASRPASPSFFDRRGPRRRRRLRRR
jgi:DNA ligase (NAD+)